MTELVGRVAPAPGERLFHPDLLAGSEPVREPLSHARKEHLQVVGPAAAVPRVKTDRIRVRPLSTELRIVELFDDLQEPRMRLVIVEGENGGNRLDHRRESTPGSGPRRVAARVERDEVAVARHLDEVRGELCGTAEEARRVDELLDDVAGVAAPETEILLAIVREDLAHRLGLVLDALARAHALEDLVVLLHRRRLDPDLVADAPQEGLVDEVGGVEVRREDDQHVERDLDLLAGVQRQVVDALLERNDPPVEQVLRCDALPSEVVDHEDAAVRLHLERRLVELRVLVEDEVERLESELAAGHDDRALRDDPTVVETQALGDDRIERRAVIDLVVDLDDLLIDLDRVREHDLATQQRHEDLGDRRLAVAGRTEEEDRFAGVHRRAELSKGLARDDHVRERVRELLLRD